MSYNKTDGIPNDHPLAQLLARSQKANKLPSCEGCKESVIDGLNPGTLCGLNLGKRYKLVHFCAAWEPKA